MGLFSKVSVMWVKRSWVIFKQKTEFYIEFGKLLMTGFLVVEDSFVFPSVISMMWCSLPFA